MTNPTQEAAQHDAVKVTMTIPETIAKLRELLAKAPAPPWTVKTRVITHIDGSPSIDQREIFQDFAHPQIGGENPPLICTSVLFSKDPAQRNGIYMSEATAELLVGAVNALPQLLTALEARESEKAKELIAAAQAVVERWDTPLWKDVPHTADYIGRLRRALDGEKSKEWWTTTEKRPINGLRYLVWYSPEAEWRLARSGKNSWYFLDKSSPTWRVSLNQFRVYRLMPEAPLIGEEK